MPCARRTEQTSLNIQINSRSLVCDMLSLVLQGYSRKFCHFAHGALMDFGIEERRTAIEAIATLAHMKNALADLILRPAGVPPEVFRPLLYQRDPNTGRTIQTTTGPDRSRCDRWAARLHRRGARDNRDSGGVEKFSSGGR